MLILPTRRQFLTGIGASTSLVAATGAYGFVIEPRHRLVVTRYAPSLPGWTEGLTLRVAVLADFHVGEPTMPLDRIAEIVDATNRLEPDLILLLGDYPSGPSVTTRKVPLVEFARVIGGCEPRSVSMPSSATMIGGMTKSRRRDGAGLWSRNARWRHAAFQ